MLNLPHTHNYTHLTHQTHTHHTSNAHITHHYTHTSHTHTTPQSRASGKCRTLSVLLSPSHRSAHLCPSLLSEGHCNGCFGTLSVCSRFLTLPGSTSDVYIWIGAFLCSQVFKYIAILLYIVISDASFNLFHICISFLVANMVQRCFLSFYLIRDSREISTTIIISDANFWFHLSFQLFLCFLVNKHKL